MQTTLQVLVGFCILGAALNLVAAALHLIVKENAANDEEGAGQEPHDAADRQPMPRRAISTDR